MKSARLALVYFLFAGLYTAPKVLLASDCVCVQYPMYPYSGDNWLHYAIRTINNCATDYPLPQIKPYTLGPEMCISATNCGTCMTLGSDEVATIFGSHVHTIVNPMYMAVNEIEETRTFLKNNTNLTGQHLINAQLHLDEMEFASPISGDLPPVVRLSRTLSNGTNQSFYAVLWKMRRTGSTAPDWAYIGMEIIDASVPAGAQEWIPSRIFRSTTIVTDGDLWQSIMVKGLLEVEFDVAGASPKVYFVRLHNTADNRRMIAFPLRAPRR